MKKEYAIEFENISKSFDNIKANSDISFKIQKGSIHAIIGENGAGKSTLMSILFGLYSPDSGVIKINGKKTFISNPNEATFLGIGMVHQHFKLVDVYTNLENIILGDEFTKKNTNLLNLTPSRQKIKALQETFLINFDLNKKTGNESVSVRQKIEIMKMLYRDSDILIFDEPTAVLTQEEIQGLLKTFEIFKKQGKTIIFISHKLHEIKQIADNATVLRQGKVSAEFKVSSASVKDMAAAMVGSETLTIDNPDKGKILGKDLIFEIKNLNLNGTKKLEDINLKIHSGEIMAIAGVEGNGQEELEKVISRMKKETSGEIKLKSTKLVKEKIKDFFKYKKFQIYLKSSFSLVFLILFIMQISLWASSKTKELANLYLALGILFLGLFLFVAYYLSIEIYSYFKIKNKYQKNAQEFINVNQLNTFEFSQIGFSYVSSDRHKHGLVLDFSLRNNTFIRRTWDKLFNFFGVFKTKNIATQTSEIISNYDVRGANEGRSISRSLSGGNQQKFIIGSEMSSSYEFILIMNPTRGLDVGAINNIHQKILQAKKDKKAILLISYELDEILTLADTIAVISNGKIVAVKSSNELTKNQIGQYMAHSGSDHANKK
ncbi:ABC transporter ATP-binding protein [Mycoplasmopsis synoviae]|uniref:ABC transporter ATP-binding protein n=1 Tax=Mycoplasmopsis synoviae TaxID=2109 RepID=UPI000CA24C4C|nr:ABC transporter ATP-binding protein [Mycoplasmopsis synoviae]AKJ21067.1 Ribose/Galactose ABC transporter, ATP-binding component [Mycoplasmopsis synoviae]AQU48404.1 Ribose/Galactose ABC transporter, ATP-binding component [Mycoplasmopsis synoviae]AWL83972.1 sugar ABC transporter ATP-binding protein [Mycoplasmopsis synoviae]QLE13701.1 sugar ABC transporter ATP-binding protein [Mycoplasmopsis synoviae]UZF64461.1 ABC transporter ATP-binding protein [Mycoplasmopsis synoviae]